MQDSAPGPGLWIASVDIEATLQSTAILSSYNNDLDDFAKSVTAPSKKSAPKPRSTDEFRCPHSGPTPAKASGHAAR